jgi:DNA polymerase-4
LGAPCDIVPSGMPHSSDLAPRLRRIIHIDMDAFYGSVEQRRSGAARGSSCCWRRGRAVGWLPRVNEARKFGVHSVTARRKCPELMFVSPRFDVYRAMSLQIRGIFAR